MCIRDRKVVLSKWIMANPKVLILDEPTRGVDVGAKSDIYTLMCKFAAQGMAIIMISSELPEVMGMSDRLLVYHEGKINGEISREEILNGCLLYTSRCVEETGPYPGRTDSALPASGNLYQQGYRNSDFKERRGALLS